MDVAPFAESGAEVFVSGEMGHYAQLDLRIVGTHHHGIGPFRHEGLADFAALLGADGDVLQVRVTGRQSTGTRKCLIESGMHATVGGDVSGERFDVGAQKFAESAVVEDGLDDGAAVRKCTQSLFVGRPGALAAFRTRIEAHLFKDYLSYLLGRRHIEPRFAGQLSHFRFPFQHAFP